MAGNSTSAQPSRSVGTVQDPVTGYRVEEDDAFGFYEGLELVVRVQVVCCIIYHTRGRVIDSIDKIRASKPSNPQRKFPEHWERYAHHQRIAHEPVLTPKRQQQLADDKMVKLNNGTSTNTIPRAAEMLEFGVLVIKMSEKSVRDGG